MKKITKKKILISFNFEDLLTKNNQKSLTKKNFILLGDWCKNNKNYKDNENLNKRNILNFYKPSDFKKKKSDSIKIFNIYEDLLEKLKKNLNLIHKKNYSKRHWEILLSRWLFTFIVDFYTIWQIANKIKPSEFSKIISLKLDKKNFITENTLHYHNSNSTSLNKLWTHYIFIQIINFIYKNKIKIEELNIKKDFNRKNSSKDDYGLNVSKIFYKNFKKKILFYNTSFDKRIALDLLKKNSFFNYFYSRKKIYNKVKIDNETRKRLHLLFPKKTNKLNQFLYKLISENIPKVFLENYKFLETTCKNLDWPKNFDYICSSYGQYYDELFKLFVAKEVSNKAKFYLFQHGYGGIFADKDTHNIKLDSKISDKFFSWGNNKKLDYQKFFYTKDFLSTPIKEFKSNNDNKILIFLYGFPDNPIRTINGFENGNRTNIKTFKYFLNIYNKVKIPKSKLHLRIQDNNINYIKNSIKLKIKNPKIEDWKKIPLKTSLKRANLCINFFVGTPFFESLFYNKPTILIYDRTMNMNFDKNFLKILNSLKKNNIVFDDSKKAGEFINKNYLNIEKWWNKKEVQKIREKFCLMYCNNYRSDLNKKKIQIF